MSAKNPAANRFDTPAVYELARRLQAALGAEYEVTRALGAGGFAVVFLVQDLKLKRKLAVKVMSPDHLTSKRALERFVREAESVAQLAHPNVVPLHFTGQHDELFFLAMQCVDGGSLSDRLAVEHHMSASEVARIMREVASALAHAHKRGIVHRDVKPQNILIEAESGRCLVADFGIAHTIDSSLTASGMLLGTPAYVSPEQVAGDPSDHRSDIYSLGVMAYELLTGKPPFESPTPAAVLLRRLSEPAQPIAEVRPDVPAPLASVIDKCLARAPGDRFQSASLIVDALSTPQAVAAERATPSTLLLNRRPRSTRVLALAAAAILIVVASLYAAPDIRSRLLGGSRIGDPVAALTIAREYYYSNKYDAAIPILKDVASDRDATKGWRKEALRYLARSYVASGKPDDAKATLRTMLALEPPLALLIPSLESDELMRLYTEARAEWATTHKQPGSGGPVQVLGIFPFRELTTDTAYRSFSRAVTDFLLVKLIPIPGLRLVARGLDSKGAIDDVNDSTYYAVESVIRAGAPPLDRAGTNRGVLRATHLMFGSVVIRGDDILISAWMYDVATGALRYSDQVVGSKKEPLAVIDHFVDKVAAGVSAGGPRQTTSR